MEQGRGRGVPPNIIEETFGKKAVDHDYTSLDDILIKYGDLLLPMHNREASIPSQVYGPGCVSTFPGGVVHSEPACTKNRFNLFWTSTRFEEAAGYDAYTQVNQPQVCAMVVDSLFDSSTPPEKAFLLKWLADTVVSGLDDGIDRAWDGLHCLNIVRPFMRYVEEIFEKASKSAKRDAKKTCDELAMMEAEELKSLIEATSNDLERPPMGTAMRMAAVSQKVSSAVSQQPNVVKVRPRPPLTMWAGESGSNLDGVGSHSETTTTTTTTTTTMRMMMAIQDEAPAIHNASPVVQSGVTTSTASGSKRSHEVERIPNLWEEIIEFDEQGREVRGCRV
jgi:hypothetical protein